EDMASLKKIILNTTLTCSSGASWYGGGGGLAFNNVKCEDGTVWGFKSYGYEAGTGDCVVEMDGKFTVTDDPVEKTTKVVDGESLDTFIEIQDWWKSSSNDDTGADLSLTYNTVTLVYDKAVTTPTEAPTETPTETPTEAPTDPSVPSNVMKGDVDLSGVVDIMDVIAINKALLGGLSLTDEQSDAADVDFNGGPDTTDALMILKYVVKLITEFKPETTAQN
ncbi:MAG: dockerin type I repeat-containing protein, partial [Oscillospiraceae bacterium]|nr:dockerin type I repeat-containing protein [Oscillospiraceae bacterium]